MRSQTSFAGLLGKPSWQSLAFYLGIAVALGGFECLFARTDYSADAISYLNIMRAIHAGSWKLALSSYWGLGYPLLLSAITPLFPHSAEWEWVAVHLLNMAIFVAAFFSFRGLVRAAARVSGPSVALDGGKAPGLPVTGLPLEGLLEAAGFVVFLSVELSMDNPSRVSPDMLVSCLLFAGARLLLDLRESASMGRAVLLGLLLGFGFVVKAIYLPLTIVFLLAMTLMLWRKPGGLRCVVMGAVAAAVVEALYIAGMSWAAGHLTLGDTGRLNYVWNVNGLDQGGLWQGEMPELGTPVHPVKLISESPHAYLFDGPFSVTYEPFFDPPYFYEGVHPVFRWREQVITFLVNVGRLIKNIGMQTVVYGLLACWLLMLRRGNSQRKGAGAICSLWPLLLICGCGIFFYLLVALEPRYISGFVCMVLLVGVVHEYSLQKREGIARSNIKAMVWILTLACGLNLMVNEKDPLRDVVGNALHHRLFCNQEQWKTAVYLRQAGLQPGSKVAVLADLLGTMRSTWAYVDQLQIIGVIGGATRHSRRDDSDVFWRASAERQEAILEQYRSAGARAVVSMYAPEGNQVFLWQRIPGTNFWVHML